jgi:hypothetical protein
MSELKTGSLAAEIRELKKEHERFKKRWFKSGEENQNFGISMAEHVRSMEDRISSLEDKSTHFSQYCICPPDDLLPLGRARIDLVEGGSVESIIMCCKLCRQLKLELAALFSNAALKKSSDA